MVQPANGTALGARTVAIAVLIAAWVALGTAHASDSLFAVALEGSPDEVRQLVAAGASPVARDANGDTPLHVAAQHNPDPNVIRALLAAGADVDSRTERGSTALMKAVWHNSAEVVLALIVGGADVALRSSDGQTALHYAARNNPAPEVVRALLAAGADVNTVSDNGRTALMQAAWHSSAEVVLALIAGGADVGALSADGQSALLYAAGNNPAPEVIHALLAAGADVDAVSVDEWGETPLMRAVQSNPSPAVVDALLNGGADPNARDSRGWTVLMLAESLGRNPDIVRVLLDAGADPTLSTLTFDADLDPSLRRAFVAAHRDLSKPADGREVLLRYPIHVHARLDGMIEVRTVFLVEEWLEGQLNKVLYRSYGAIYLGDFFDALTVAEMFTFHSGLVAYELGGSGLTNRVSRMLTVLTVRRDNSRDEMIVPMVASRRDGSGYVFSGDAFLRAGGTLTRAGTVRDGSVLTVPPALGADGRPNEYSRVYEFFGLLTE
jgi:ankyrin repeat protein